MAFIRVLNDIRINQKNFKTWETEENDNDERRKVLYEKGIGKDRFEETKAKGDLIIDTITRMDQHSENVGEDVEAVTSQIQSLAVLGALFGGVFAGGKLVANSEKAYNTAFEALQNDAKYKPLIQDLTQANKAKFDIPRQGLTKIESSKTLLKSRRTGTDLLTYYFKDMKKDLPEFYAANKTAIDGFAKEADVLKKTLSRGRMFGISAGAAIPIVAFIAAVLAATKLQLHGSRVARWQSRENMKDEKNFVIYTPEQIEKAKQSLAANPPKKDGWFGGWFGKKDAEERGFFQNWLGLAKDFRKYNDWKKNDTDDSKKVMRDLAPEELAEAKSDQATIQRIVKKINNKAEVYSQNMETAATTIFGSSLLGGWLLGKGADWIIQKTGVTERYFDSVLRKYTTAEIADGVKEIFKQDSPLKPFEKRAKGVEVFEQIQAYMKSPEGKNLSTLNKLKSFAATSPMCRTKLGAYVSTFIVGIAGTFLTLNLQKNAARAGRYKAKEEFKQNPQEYLHYTPKEIQNVKEITSTPKTLGERAWEYFTFLPRCIADMRAYGKYKKGELKDTKVLQKELQKIEISAEQTREAKNMQRKLFNTFEKVDENSQLYSETMEAANEMAQPVIIYGGIAAACTPLIAVAIGLATGKISVAKAADWFTSIAGTGGGLFAKTGWFKRYMSQAADNAATIIKGVELDSTPIADMVKQYRSAKLNDIVKTHLGDIDLNNFKIDKSFISDLIDKFAPTPEAKAALNQVFKAQNTDEIAENIMQAMRKNNIDTAKIMNMSIDDIIKVLPKAEIGQTAIKLLPSKVETFAGLKLFTSRTLSDNALKELSEHTIGVMQVGKVDKAYVMKMIDKLEKLAGSVPQKEFFEAFNKILAAAAENPDKFMHLIKENPDALMASFNTPIFRQTLLAAGISWGVFTTGMMFMLSSYFAKLQLEAGRLGVMKSLNELSDYKYYADVEAKEIANTPKRQVAATDYNNLQGDNILKRLMNKHSAA